MYMCIFYLSTTHLGEHSQDLDVSRRKQGGIGNLTPAEITNGNRKRPSPISVLHPPTNATESPLGTKPKSEMAMGIFHLRFQSWPRRENPK